MTQKYFSYFQYTSGPLYFLTTFCTAVHAWMPILAFKERENLSCFPKVVKMFSSSQLLTHSSITRTAFLKNKLYFTSVLLRNIFSSNPEWATVLSIRSQSFSRIDVAVPKSAKFVSRPPLWRWSVSYRVFHSFSVVVSHIRRKSDARTIKELSSDVGVVSTLIALRSSLHYMFFICFSMFLSLYVQRFSGSLNECSTLLLFCCPSELCRFCPLLYLKSFLDTVGALLFL